MNIRDVLPCDEERIRLLLGYYGLQYEGLDGFIVAEQDGKIMGCARLDAAQGEIHSIAVHPTYRGHGIGSSLVKALEAKARTGLYARTTAPGFFVKMGYTPLPDERKRAWSDCMQCELFDKCTKTLMYRCLP